MRDAGVQNRYINNWIIFPREIFSNAASVYLCLLLSLGNTDDCVGHTVTEWKCRTFRVIEYDILY